MSFRLPTEEEWKIAALGNILEVNRFPWGSPYIRNSEGQVLANMLRVSGNMIKNYWDEDGNQRIEILERDLKEYHSLTSEVASYNKTKHGLHDRYGGKCC